jgi:predicted nucleic acid-binding protein
MRFWDSSAIVPLLVAEPRSDEMEASLRADPAVVVWWGTPVECMAALCRREREGRLSAEGHRAAMGRLRAGLTHWTRVPASDDVREQAMRLLRLHPLRSADALQLAAAIVAANFQPGSLDFICLDVRICEAAEREGFRIGG